MGEAENDSDTKKTEATGHRLAEPQFRRGNLSAQFGYEVEYAHGEQAEAVGVGRQIWAGGRPRAEVEKPGGQADSEGEYDFAPSLARDVVDATQYFEKFGCGEYDGEDYGKDEHPKGGEVGW